MEKTKDKEEVVQTTYDFNCLSCNMNEKAHYKGTNPPFSRNVVLKYRSYIMKDPFSPPGKGEILVLGSDCQLCEKQVCLSKTCSVFYGKTYCLDCVHKSLDKFPVEIRSKLNSTETLVPET
ncbi:cysteine-rich domain-containing protein [Phthorimaea operculella]|nr:cysteine-rich domain-containing protein [Phthorimaea operculella]